MERTELGTHAQMDRERAVRRGARRLACVNLRDKHRDGARRLDWYVEERIRIELATLFDDYIDNPDDIAITIDETIDIIATEFERVTTT